jgi:hypothetical protein
MAEVIRRIRSDLVELEIDLPSATPGHFPSEKARCAAAVQRRASRHVRFSHASARKPGIGHSFLISSEVIAMAGGRHRD